MLNVTLVRGVNDKLEGGLVKLRLRRDGWYWDFFESKNWDRQSGSEKGSDSSSNWFQIDEIRKSMHIEGNAVTFLATVNGLDFTQPYTLIFAGENDTKSFTAKTRG